MKSTIAVALLSIVFLVTEARAADAFYLGTWTIESAVVAPWWYDPAHKPDPTEMKAFDHKNLVITRTAITGPRELVCKAPKYKVEDYPADFLFQGSFGEMHERDKSVDPAQVAAKLGFKGKSWKTLVTGCGNELEIHFLDPSTAAIGLNNYIYFLKKQP